MKKIEDKWNAKDYAENSSAQQSWANELIDKLALQGNEHFLDIGAAMAKSPIQSPGN